MTNPSIYMTRMGIFLVLAVAGAAVLHRQLIEAFFANPAINGVIVVALAFGLAFVFRQVWVLRVEVNWIETYRSQRPGMSVAEPPAPARPHGRHDRRPAGPASAQHHVHALDPRRHQRPSRRIPGHFALSHRPADFPRPARHLLGPAPDRERRGRRDRRPAGLGRRPGQYLQRPPSPASKRHCRAWGRHSARPCSVSPARCCSGFSNCRPARPRTVSTTTWRTG